MSLLLSQSYALEDGQDDKSEEARKRKTEREFDEMSDDEIFTSSFLNLLDEMESKSLRKMETISRKRSQLIEEEHADNQNQSKKKNINYKSSSLSSTPVKLETGKILNPNQCIMCFAQFNCHRKLLRHIETHTGEKSHACSICNLSFARLLNLMQHKIVHLAEKPYQCFCGKGFKHSASLKRHEKIHTGGKKTICGEYFKSSFQLKNHERSHTRLYQCVPCRKVFNHRNSLKRHEGMHSGKKSQCKICSKDFRDSYELKLHERVHSREEPYRCRVCGKSFRWKRILKQHEETHENN